jgi:hypothetical protein
VPELAPPAVAEPPAAVVGNHARDAGGDGTDLTLPLLALIGLLAVVLAIRNMTRTLRD